MTAFAVSIDNLAAHNRARVRLRAIADELVRRPRGPIPKGFGVAMTTTDWKPGKPHPRLEAMALLYAVANDGVVVDYFNEIPADEFAAGVDRVARVFGVGEQP